MLYRHGTSASIKSGNFNNILKTIISNKIKHYVIFDDFERSYIEPQILFGYINSFVEHHGLNVIIIANTDSSTKNNNHDIIQKTKEKIIGAEFTVEPELDIAFQFFIDNMPTDAKEIYDLGTISIIKKVFSILQYNNLRSLHQALLSFNYFYHLFPIGMVEILKNRHQKYFFTKSEKDDFSEIIEAFFYFSFEKSFGVLLEPEYNKGYDIYRRYSLSYKKFIDLPNEKRKTFDEPSKMLGVNTYNIFAEHWFAVIHNKPLVLSILKNLNLELLQQIEHSKDVVWQFINNFPEFTKAEIKRLSQELINNIKRMQYVIAGELLHAAGILLYLSDQGFISNKKGTIVKLFCDIFKRKSSHIDGIHIGLRDHYGGHGYFGNTLIEFQTIFNWTAPLKLYTFI